MKILFYYTQSFGREMISSIFITLRIRVEIFANLNLNHMFE